MIEFAEQDQRRIDKTHHAPSPQVKPSIYLRFSPEFLTGSRIEEARSSETLPNGSWRVEQTAGAVKTRSMASVDERRREKHLAAVSPRAGHCH
jgi:hypothetical protein